MQRSSVSILWDTTLPCNGAIDSCLGGARMLEGLALQCGRARMHLSFSHYIRLGFFALNYEICSFIVLFFQ